MNGYDRRTCRENGFPYEYAVRMCNDLNTDAWINLPCTADDDYVRNFGNLVLYGSDPAGKVYTAPGGANPRPANPPSGWYPPLKEGLNCWVEYENEVWNWGYASFAYHQIKGQFHNRSTYEEYAEGVKHVSDILKPQFAAAGRAAALKIVFCNQLNGGWGDHATDDAFSYIEKHYGPVSSYYDYYAEAPYSGHRRPVLQGLEDARRDSREGPAGARYDDPAPAPQPRPPRRQVEPEADHLRRRTVLGGRSPGHGPARPRQPAGRLPLRSVPQGLAGRLRAGRHLPGIRHVLQL